jgi:hypothetical protein
MLQTGRQPRAATEDTFKDFTNLPTGFNGSYWSRQPNVTFFASFSAFSLAVRSALSRLFSSLHGQTGKFR